jgi:hypothetical protein
MRCTNDNVGATTAFRRIQQQMQVSPTRIQDRDEECAPNDQVLTQKGMNTQLPLTTSAQQCLYPQRALIMLNTPTELYKFDVYNGASRPQQSARLHSL